MPFQNKVQNKSCRI